MLERYKNVIFAAVIIAIASGIVTLLTNRPTPVTITIIPPGPTATPPPIRVYVTGAVANPQMYTLPPGSRWQDAIDAAGGAAQNADLQRINLAQFVHDGDKVEVPAANPNAATSNTSKTAVPAAGTNFPIHINTATLEELQLLPGVGPAMAQRIIDYRNANGPFKSMGDLDRVSGIGPSRIKEWEGKIVFD
jgi:competence protein ComEA